MKKKALVYFGLFLAIYLMTAFVKADFNFLNWDEAVRLSVCIIYVLLAVVMTPIIYGFDN